MPEVGLAFQFNATECVETAWPVPDRVTVVGEPVALLATLTLAPVTAPATVGANVTVSVAVCPGDRIVLLATPLALNPAPVTVTLEMVTLEFPLFVNVEVCWLELFTFIVPKLKLAGLAPKIRVAATPVPVRLMVNGEGVPFVVSLTLPLMVVAEVGVKIALNVRLPPAAIVEDVVSPVTLMPVPAMTMLENVSVALPLLCSVIGCELLFPTTTFEKAMLVGDAEICACMPVPLSGIVAGEPGALLEMEMLPAALPEEVGVNVTVNTLFAPALMVFGAVRFMV
jgi:hypothetical protein